MDEPQKIQVTRQDLYDQVWSMPVSRLCRTYGLSDVGLAKICAEWEIPCPARGYWAKKRNGKPTRKRKLKQIEEGNPVIFSYMPGPPVEAQSQRPPTPSEQQRTFEKRPENHIAVADNLADPHPLVARTEKSIRRAEPDDSGICRPEAKRCLNVAVSAAQIDRSLRILDALVKALEARGLTVSVNGDNFRTEAHVLDELVGFQLFEETKRQEREPTPEEKEEDAKWERFRHIWPIRPRYEWVPTGRLILKIIDGEGLRRCWTDRSDRKVEQFLNSFIVGLVRAAEAMKEKRADNEKRRREQEEQERRRQEEKQRRREEERLRQIEEERFKKLEAEVAAWNKAEQIRAYLVAVRAAQEKAGGITPGSDLDTWLKWAQCRADGLDPLARLSITY
jgi:hypothetical protein